MALRRRSYRAQSHHRTAHSAGGKPTRNERNISTPKLRPTNRSTASPSTIRKGCSERNHAHLVEKHFCYDGNHDKCYRQRHQQLRSDLNALSLLLEESEEPSTRSRHRTLIFLLFPTQPFVTLPLKAVNSYYPSALLTLRLSLQTEPSLKPLEANNQEGLIHAHM